jgi:hypothetical protein
MKGFTLRGPALVILLTDLVWRRRSCLGNGTYAAVKVGPKTLDPGESVNNTVFLQRPKLSLGRYRLDIRYEASWAGDIKELDYPNAYNVTFR